MRRRAAGGDAAPALRKRKRKRKRKREKIEAEIESGPHVDRRRDNISARCWRVRRSHTVI